MIGTIKLFLQTCVLCVAYPHSTRQPPVFHLSRTQAEYTKLSR